MSGKQVAVNPKKATAAAKTSAAVPETKPVPAPQARSASVEKRSASASKKGNAGESHSESETVASENNFISDILVLLKEFRTLSDDALNTRIASIAKKAGVTLPRKKRTADKTEYNGVKPPTGAKAAYIIFTCENRTKVIAENQGISFEDVGKELGRRWEALKDSEKEIYHKKADADKERYAREKEVYLNAKAAATGKPTESVSAPAVARAVSPAPETKKAEHAPAASTKAAAKASAAKAAVESKAEHGAKAEHHTKASPSKK